MLADIQNAGPGMSFESYRKALAQGKKKDVGVSTGRRIVLAGRKLQSRSKTWRPDTSNGKRFRVFERYRRT